MKSFELLFIKSQKKFYCDSVKNESARAKKRPPPSLFRAKIEKRNVNFCVISTKKVNMCMITA